MRCRALELYIGKGGRESWDGGGGRVEQWWRALQPFSRRLKQKGGRALREVSSKQVVKKSVLLCLGEFRQKPLYILTSWLASLSLFFLFFFFYFFFLCLLFFFFSFFFFLFSSFLFFFFLFGTVPPYSTPPP